MTAYGVSSLTVQLNGKKNVMSGSPDAIIDRSAAAGTTGFAQWGTYNDTNACPAVDTAFGGLSGGSDRHAPDQKDDDRDGKSTGDSPHASRSSRAGNSPICGDFGDGPLGASDTDCPYCHRTYRQPRLLHCLHALCEDCIIAQLERRPDEPSGGRRPFGRGNTFGVWGMTGSNTNTSTPGHQSSGSGSHSQPSTPVGRREASLDMELEPSTSPEQRPPPGVIRCPVCKQESQVGNDIRFVNNLLLDYVTLNLLDSRAMRKQQIMCESCKTKETAVARCQDCAKFLCRNCVQAHQFMTCFDGHRVVDFADGGSNASFNDSGSMSALGDTNNTAPTNEVVLVRRPIVCTEHPGEPYRYTCDTCAAPICDQCARCEHRPGEGHRVHKIDENTDRMLRTELEQVLAVANRRMGAATESHRNFDSRLEDLRNRVDLAKENVQQAFDEFREILDEHRNQMLQQLDTLYARHERDMNTTFKTLANTTEKVNDGSRFAHRLLTHGDTIELLLSRRTVLDQLVQLLHTMPHPSAQSQLQFVYSKNAFSNALYGCCGHFKDDAQVAARASAGPDETLAAVLRNNVHGVGAPLTAIELAPAPLASSASRPLQPDSATAPMGQPLHANTPLTQNNSSGIGSDVTQPTMFNSSTSSVKSGASTTWTTGDALDVRSPTTLATSAPMPTVSLAGLSAALSGWPNAAASGVQQQQQQQINLNQLAQQLAYANPGNPVSMQDPTAVFAAALSNLSRMTTPNPAAVTSSAFGGMTLGAQGLRQPGGLQIDPKLVAAISSASAMPNPWGSIMTPGLQGNLPTGPPTANRSSTGSPAPMNGRSPLPPQMGMGLAQRGTAAQMAHNPLAAPGIRPNMAAAPVHDIFSGMQQDRSEIRPIGTIGSNGSAGLLRTPEMQQMTVLRRFGTVGQGNGQFNSPHGFCLGFDTEIVVADTNNHRIQVFSKSAEYLFQFGVAGKADGELWYPRKVAVLTKDGERFYVVCDRGNERSRMQIFRTNGQFVKKIVIRYVDIVAGLAVDEDSNIVAVDSVSPTVFRIGVETGQLLKWFDCSSNMKEPSDIAVARREYYICDFKGHCVCVYSADGQHLRTVGSMRLTSFPNGIDVSDAGDVLVGDSHGNRFHVVVFRRDGTLQAEFECTDVKVSRCCGLRINNEGHIVTLAKNNHYALIMNTLFVT